MPIDRVPFYTDEQFQSADLVTLQRNAERALEDITAYRERPYDVPAVGDNAAGGNQPAAAVLGGLFASVSGTLLQIYPGALVTTSVPSPDNPSSSGAYLAVNVERVDVSLPSPLGDAWYIVAGRPVLVNAPAEQRRVWDRPGRKWQDPSPNLVKLQTSKMVCDVVACPDPTQLSAPLPANAVPLYGVFRPAGGGAIDELVHLVDLRPFRAHYQSLAPGAQYLRNDWTYVTGAGLELSVHVRLDEVDLIAETTGGPIDPLLCKDPSDPAPSVGEWWYLYLARHRPLGELCLPRHAQLNVDGLKQQGLLILSRVPPTPPGTFDRHPSTGITAPLPFSTTETSVLDAVCFGALRYTGSAWAPCQCDQGRVTMLGNQTPTEHGVSVHNFNFDTGAPLGARAVLLQLDSTAAATAWEIDRPDGTVSLYYRNLPAVAERRMVFEVPLAPLGPSTTLRFRSTTDGTWAHCTRGYRF